MDTMDVFYGSSTVAEESSFSVYLVEIAWTRLIYR